MEMLSEKYPGSDEMQNERMNEERNNKAAADKAEHEKFMDNFDCTSYGKVYYNYLKKCCICRAERWLIRRNEGEKRKRQDELE